MRIIAAFFIMLIGVAFCCGCTTNSAGASPAATNTVATQSTPQGPVVTVSLEESSYDPVQLYIRTGTTVTWVNGEDRISRRVVHMPSEATGNILFQSESLAPGESYSYTFTKPGRYIYADPQHGGGRSPFVEVTT